MLIIKSADIVATAVKPAQYPPADLPEVAFCGRSNVGKSTLLNYLTGRKSLARVSGSPGKTRTINFYELNGSFRVADLPGYGYAKVSRAVSEKWGAMMDQYFQTRPCLKTAVLLVDIRHDPTGQDIQMYDYLKYYGLAGMVAATKADKLSRAQAQKNAAAIRKKLGMEKEAPLIPVSALKRTGGDLLLAELARALELEEE